LPGAGRAQATHDTAMPHVSDHGESLGEGGSSLHGMPGAIVLDVQTPVYDAGLDLFGPSRMPLQVGGK
jgi:hypothetical protein